MMTERPTILDTPNSGAASGETVKTLRIITGAVEDDGDEEFSLTILAIALSEMLNISENDGPAA